MSVYLTVSGVIVGIQALAVTVTTALFIAAARAVRRREARAARTCPWCDDPDEIDSSRCNCTEQCPMGLCCAPAVSRG